jgi:FdhD protein
MEKVKSVVINKCSANGEIQSVQDKIVTEAPLQILIGYNSNGNRTTALLSVTMRTPGDDHHLVTGFLYNEGIIKNAGDIISTKHINDDENMLLAELADHVVYDPDANKRNFIANSSCGFCGRMEDTSKQYIFSGAHESIHIAVNVLYGLPSALRSAQGIFSETGGAHAVALVNLQSRLLHLCEDAGRHNAMDKLTGILLEQNMLPVQNAIVVFSGRLSYELIQKSLMAGVQVVCGIGAPTSLAIELAEQNGITVIGFLKSSSMNIYCGAERIIGA